MIAFPLWFLLSYIYLVGLADQTHASNSSSSFQGKAIFILAGQSNMSGRGGVVNDTWDGYVPPESGPRPSILRLDAGLNWAEAKEPLHKDIDVSRTCGVGPGMAFANSLLDKDSSIGMVGLVPCAIGGTNISEWAPGGHLYSGLVRRAEAAVESGGVIAGMLWYQGESDTESRQQAELYQRRLERFFVHLRADLLSPSVPIIQVALASAPPRGAYIEIVREAQLGMHLPNVRCVDAKGSQLEPDRLHLTTPAQVRLGEMLADAFLQTLPTPPSSNSAPTRKQQSNVNLSFLGIASCSYGSPPDHLLAHANPSRSQPKNVILLAGQSNMSGRGGIVNHTWDGFVPTNSRPNLSILRLAAGLTWVKAHDPLHKDIDVNATCGVGPGMAFAHRLLKKKGRPGFKLVALVPCAVGGRFGTRLSDWVRGSFLYNQLVTRAKASQRGGGTIRALLWYQGESDMVLLEDANSYKAKLETFFTQLRADIGSPMLPIIQVALASGQGQYIEKVREAQLGIKLPNVKCVDAKHLQLLPDRLHLSTPAQVRLGEMLADAFLHMRPTTIPTHTNAISP